MARSFSVHDPTCIIELKKILSYQTMSIVLIFISEYTCIIDKEEPFYAITWIQLNILFWVLPLLVWFPPKARSKLQISLHNKDYFWKLCYWWMIYKLYSHNVTSHDSREIHYCSTINAGNDFAKKQNKDLQSIKKSCCWLKADLLLTYGHDHVVPLIISFYNLLFVA